MKPTQPHRSVEISDWCKPAVLKMSTSNEQYFLLLNCVEFFNPFKFPKMEAVVNKFMLLLFYTFISA